MGSTIASGLPVITTPTGGFRDLIKDNGIIVPARDPEGIVRAVRKLIDEPETMSMMGLRSRQIGLKNSWNVVGQMYLEIYNQCTQS